ncbi:MAG: aminodeoxychorismate/anthranilate synthase component II [Planctomycetota bacterium]
MDVLVVDNRDSFTFNLAQELQGLGASVRVVRSVDVRPRDVLEAAPGAILLGPGPGEPAGAGCSEALVRGVLEAGETAPPLFGVCLGHQALATALGGRLRRATTLVHGATRPVRHDGDGLFDGAPDPLELARYNSLVVDENALPDALEITARTDDGDIAGLRHRSGRLEGVQGHPESILCVELGRRLLGNMLEAARS